MAEYSNQNQTDTEGPACPECGDRLYQHSYPSPTLYCDSCEREYWRAGDKWYSCDETGEEIDARVVGLGDQI